MIIWYSIFLLLCLYNVNIIRSGIRDDYLSMEKTASIKGIFILLVFFSHFNSYVTYTGIWDKTFVTLLGYIGQAMVAMFLFYSGYGMMESLKNKEKYVDTIPRKRILSVLLRFDVAVLVFLFVRILFRGEITIK